MHRLINPSHKRYDVSVLTSIVFVGERKLREGKMGVEGAGL